MANWLTCKFLIRRGMDLPAQRQIFLNDLKSELIPIIAIGEDHYAFACLGQEHDEGENAFIAAGV